MKSVFLVAFVFFSFYESFSQTNSSSNFSSFFQSISLNIDTLSFNSSKDLIQIRNENHLAFEFKNDEQIAEIKLFPNTKNLFENKKLSLLISPDFDLMDSIVFFTDSYFKFRVRFKSISKSEFLNFTFVIQSNEKIQFTELKLFPYTQTKATFYPSTDDLYIGEEKTFEIISNNIQNLKLSGEWVKLDGIDYRLFERNGMAFISILPTSLGNIKLELEFEAKKPFIDGKKKMSYVLEKQDFNFNVKGSRLSFLKIDKREIIKESNNKEGVEIQLDNNRNLLLNKTYRIEDREESGGPLVGELYTMRRLSNDKILCMFRPYLHHLSQDGYLFIKNGDKAEFITNINILPETKVTKLSILREGKNWTNENTVYPGETIEIKIEGEGLSQARFYFEDLEDISADSLTRNNKFANYRVKIPINIRKKTIELYNFAKKTGFFLQVVEYQKARPLDFVYLNYGETPKIANTLNQPILYRHTVRDIVISFDPSKIDLGDVLYGKQFLEIEIRITGKKDELIEMQKIENIEICPDENSPRVAFYNSLTCNKQEIRINSFLTRKTHSLDHWSKIELIIKHKADKYNGEGFTQKIELYLQKLSTFDVDVSFPTGLVIKRIGVDGFPGLGGISLAMLAQFSFYDKEKIKRLKPYKIGAGFLAQNAFNFNPDVNDRDLGIVILGSVYPTRKDAKMTFPLYAGFGYFLNEDNFFYLIGPGIRINF
jgi:hypothetical protein